jgi:hypothetical protein
MTNQYPTFDSSILQNQSNKSKEYPTFSQVNQINSVDGKDVRLDAQGSLIQAQPLPNGNEIPLNKFINTSNSELYDVNYDSGSAKTNQIQIPHNYQNNNNYNHKYVPSESIKLSSVPYNSNQANDNNNAIKGRVDYNNIISQNINQNKPEYYDFIQSPPHGPHMFPQFPHHHPHQHFPHLPPNVYPYESEYYAYC